MAVSPVNERRAAGGALADREFADRMAAFAPFEAAPRVACAVSGGGDSLALLLLLDVWARGRGGRVVALTVDHRLRPEAAEESRRVADLCRARGIEHHLLVWRDARAGTGLQARARQARYRLMAEFCERQGILHLALAHQRQDQGETLLLRLQSGSGLDGLAGMAPCRELAGLRLLRPLLDVDGARLRARLRCEGVSWSEDPSNRDPGFARVRLRRMRPLLARSGLSPEALGETAAAFAALRRGLDAQTARLLVRVARLDPAGYLLLDPAQLAAAPPLHRRRLLAAALRTVGGRRQAPRGAGLERLCAALVEDPPPPATLGGCRIVPWRGQLLVVREVAAATQPIRAGEALDWDGRFRLRLRLIPGADEAGYVVAPLGEAGWASLVAACPQLRATRIPAPARSALPALCDLDGPVAVPHLLFQRSPGPAARLVCAALPPWALAPAAFAVPYPGAQSRQPGAGSAVRARSAGRAHCEGTRL